MLPPWRRRITHKVNLAEGHPQWKLPHMEPCQRDNVNKFSPESEETQKGHMCTQRQGVQSTKATAQQAAPLSAAQTGYSPPNKTSNSEEPESVTITKIKEIFIDLYKTCDTIYPDQTSKFPHNSSRGNIYQMPIHKIEETQPGLSQ